jgi:hypothetical protein
MAEHNLRQGLRFLNSNDPIRSIQPRISVQGRQPRPLGPSWRVLRRSGLCTTLEVEKGQGGNETTGREGVVRRVDSIFFFFFVPVRSHSMIEETKKMAPSRGFYHLFV